MCVSLCHTAESMLVMMPSLGHGCVLCKVEAVGSHDVSICTTVRVHTLSQAANTPKQATGWCALSGSTLDLCLGYQKHTPDWGSGVRGAVGIWKGSRARVRGPRKANASGHPRICYTGGFCFSEPPKGSRMRMASACASLKAQR